MNENNMNPEIQNETNKAVYASDFVMTKEIFYNLSCVSYNKFKKCLLLSLCLLVYIVLVNILSRDYHIVPIGIFISAFMFFMFFIIKNSAKVGYERTVLTVGKDPTTGEELFEDKIVSKTNDRTREYSYQQITGLFETKDFLLLHLKHQVYITINKYALNADVDEVKSFLIGKCTRVKKKKFINCSNDKMISLILCIAIMFIAIIATVTSIVLTIVNSINLY